MVPSIVAIGIACLWLPALPLLALAIGQSLGVILSLVAIRRAGNRRTSPGCATCSTVAILCPTCDDFDPEACASLLSQAGVKTELFLLDDSTDAANRAALDSWVRQHAVHASVIRREDRRGFKAGNLNHWLSTVGNPRKYPYLLVVDADEVLPPDFARRLLDAMEREDAAFAQGCHMARPAQTPFQALLGLHVDVNWRYVIPARNLTGLPWMLGHGVLLRTADLVAVGGFPEVVSEDLAFTIALAEHGRLGVAVPDAVAWEEFPRSFVAYWRRLSRWISADVEIVMTVLPRLWRTTLGMTAKLDLTVRELRLPLLAGGWLVLLGTALHAVLPRPFTCALPAGVWCILLPLMIPYFAAGLLRFAPPLRRASFVSLMPFIAMAGLALYPPAVGAGLGGRHTFTPTGGARDNRAHAGLALWECGSGAVFLGTGLYSANWTLVAVGLAIALAPLLRLVTHPAVLVVGATTFWALIAIQIVLDFSAGQTRPEHLLPLAALGAATD